MKSSGKVQFQPSVDSGWTGLNLQLVGIHFILDHLLKLLVLGHFCL